MRFAHICMLSVLERDKPPIFADVCHLVCSKSKVLSCRFEAWRKDRWLYHWKYSYSAVWTSVCVCVCMYEWRWCGCLLDIYSLRSSTPIGYGVVRVHPCQPRTKRRPFFPSFIKWVSFLRSSGRWCAKTAVWRKLIQWGWKSSKTGLIHRFQGALNAAK